MTNENQKKLELLIQKFEEENRRHGGRWGDWTELFTHFRDSPEDMDLREPAFFLLMELLKEYFQNSEVNERGERVHDTTPWNLFSDILVYTKNLGAAAKKIQEILEKNGLKPDNEPVPMGVWAEILPLFDNELIAFVKIREILEFCYVDHPERCYEEEILSEYTSTGWRYRVRNSWGRWQALFPLFRNKDRFACVHVVNRLRELCRYFQKNGRCKE